MGELDVHKASIVGFNTPAKEGRIVRRIGLALVLLLGACTSTQPITSAPSPSGEAPDKTIVDIVDWSKLLKSKPSAEFSVPQCEESGRVWREDALRCWVGYEIYDPCFRSHQGAICPHSPWSRNYDLIKTEKYPPLRAATSKVDPWALETVEGIRCIFLSGATLARKGLTNSYGCDDGTLLWGSPTRNALWTMKASTGSRTAFYEIRLRKAIY